MNGGPPEPAPFRAWFGRVEIPAADPTRTAAFYRRVFGWETREVEGGGAPYVSLRPDGEGPAGGGVTTAPVLGAAVPLAVIHVEDGVAEGSPGRGAADLLAAVLERVVAHGGGVDLEPSRVGGHGWFARFTDPDGNLLGLWAAAAGQSAARPPSSATRR